MCVFKPFFSNYRVIVEKLQTIGVLKTILYAYTYNIITTTQHIPTVATQRSRFIIHREL